MDSRFLGVGIDQALYCTGAALPAAVEKICAQSVIAGGWVSEWEADQITERGSVARSLESKWGSLTDTGVYLLTPLRNRGDGAQENKMAKKATLEQLTFSMMWIRLQTSRLYWNGYFALSVVNTYCSFIVVGCRTLSFPQQYRGGRVSRFWSYYAHAYTHPSPPPSHLAPLPLSGSPERATLPKLICLLQHRQGVVNAWLVLL